MGKKLANVTKMTHDDWLQRHIPTVTMKLSS